MTTAELLERVEGVKRQGAGWVARCPAHEDRHASLSIADAGDNVVLRCHAGCDFAAVMAALSSVGTTVPSQTERIVDATYAYHDADGTHLYDVVRIRPKDFASVPRMAPGAWPASSAFPTASRTYSRRSAASSSSKVRRTSTGWPRSASPRPRTLAGQGSGGRSSPNTCAVGRWSSSRTTTVRDARMRTTLRDRSTASPTFASSNYLSP